MVMGSAVIILTTILFVTTLVVPLTFRKGFTICKIFWSNGSNGQRKSSMPRYLLADLQILPT